MQSLQLYTIGYEDRNIGDFINRLQYFGIETLIDVREVPISRKPGFSKGKLRESLEIANIKYIHVKELGSPKDLRQKLYDDKDYDYFFEEYRNYLNTKVKTVEDLYGYAIVNEACCLMCMEREPIYCHRKIVAEKIKEVDGNGLKIKHI